MKATSSADHKGAYAVLQTTGWPKEEGSVCVNIRLTPKGELIINVTRPGQPIARRELSPELDYQD